MIFFENLDQQLYASGARIKSYDMDTGEVSVYRERPGGAFNPSLSPDGRYMVYGHRDDQETILVLHDLDTREERVLVRGLDRDHQESGPYYYGVSPNVSWHRNGNELFAAFGGKIRAVNVNTGQVREIPFQAPVHRELDETIRFPIEFPQETARTYANRWAHRTDAGIVFEALGDIYLKRGGRTANLTESPEHETSPVIDVGSSTLYYASWTDEELGGVYRRPLGGGTPTRVSTRPSQYGSLALSPDGGTLAFVRGRGLLQNGTRLENQTQFELVLVGPGGAERKVTDVSEPIRPTQHRRVAANLIAFGPRAERRGHIVADDAGRQRFVQTRRRQDVSHAFDHAIFVAPMGGGHRHGDVLGNLVVAVDAGNLLDQVNLARKVPSPTGSGRPHRSLVDADVAVAKGGQDAAHLVHVDLDPQYPFYLRQSQRDRFSLGPFAADVDHPGGQLASGQIENQLAAAAAGPIDTFRVDSPLKAVRGGAV